MLMITDEEAAQHSMRWPVSQRFSHSLPAVFPRHDNTQYPTQTYQCYGLVNLFISFHCIFCSTSDYGFAALLY